MTDILDRLHDDGSDICDEAAAEIGRLRALLKEAADELAFAYHDQHPNRADYPDEMRRYNRDMDLVNRIREALGDD